MALPCSCQPPARDDGDPIPHCPLHKASLFWSPSRVICPQNAHTHSDRHARQDSWALFILLTVTTRKELRRRQDSQGPGTYNWAERQRLMSPVLPSRTSLIVAEACEQLSGFCLYLKRKHML